MWTKGTKTTGLWLTGAALITILVLSAMLVAVPPVRADKPPGKLAFKFNIIGVPRDTAAPGAEDGNGRRIFIPLKTTWYSDPCDTVGGQNNPGAKNIPVEVPAKGVSIKVSEGPFDIVDGDAVEDKEAKFTMPTAEYDVYVIAKGKPGGCLDLEAYTYEGETLIFIGSIDVDRTNGKPKWQSIKGLLYGNGFAWFADPYEGYFWQLYNNGLRNMEVRFYEVSP